MYEMYRVFCALPGEFGEERLGFYDAVGEFNGTVGMPRGILFVPVVVSSARRAASPLDVNANIRASSFYIEVLAEDSKPVERNRRLGYRLAEECRTDPALPMREVAVVREGADFSDLAGFKQRVRGLLSDWIPQ